MIFFNAVPSFGSGQFPFQVSFATIPGYPIVIIAGRKLPLPVACAPSYNKCFMPVFRIHRMKEAPKQQFRSAAHVSGAANVKPKDYEAAAEVEADNEYAAWALLRATEQPLSVGD